MKVEFFVNLLFALVFYVFSGFLINAVQGWETKLGLIILVLCVSIGYFLCWKLEHSIDQQRELRKHDGLGGFSHSPPSLSRPVYHASKTPVFHIEESSIRL